MTKKHYNSLGLEVDDVRLNEDIQKCIENGKYFVYLHTSPEEKYYVGITKETPYKRFKDGKGYLGQKKMRDAINKYPWEDWNHEILNANLDKYQALSYENYYINKLKSYDLNYGYNTTVDKKVNEIDELIDVPNEDLTIDQFLARGNNYKKIFNEIKSSYYRYLECLENDDFTQEFPGVECFKDTRSDIFEIYSRVFNDVEKNYFTHIKMLKESQDLSRYLLKSFEAEFNGYIEYNMYEGIIGINKSKYFKEVEIDKFINLVVESRLKTVFTRLIEIVINGLREDEYDNGDELVIQSYPNVINLFKNILSIQYSVPNISYDNYNNDGKIRHYFKPDYILICHNNFFNFKSVSNNAISFKYDINKRKEIRGILNTILEKLNEVNSNDNSKDISFDVIKLFVR